MFKPQAGDIWEYRADAKAQHHYLLIEKRKHLADCYDALCLNSGTTTTIAMNDTLDWVRAA